MNYAIIRSDVNHLLDLISPEQAWARPSTNYHSYLMSNLVFVLIEIVLVESPLFVHSHIGMGQNLLLPHLEYTSIHHEF